ncbi:hypothetical protein FISHEDRAFT_45617 [Fistulina hepatica ATCC 64428]|uniref:Uncharacterized protein n=1 Tax=Fistulina hepatica ATCC 64428 TaxID=1128425 RepID=A0A0D7ABF6_9AGAR|nr:hypothetical protein FISHEDRAFT_45617 [Fistulina hepatica ATCC 64428]
MASTCRVVDLQSLAQFDSSFPHARDRNSVYLRSKYTYAQHNRRSLHSESSALHFLQPTDSQQGTQNKLYSMFMSTFISVPLAQQLQTVFLNIRSVYEACEYPGRMYSWTALATSQTVVAILWNLDYTRFDWTVGFPTNRAGYQYLHDGHPFPLVLYYRWSSRRCGDSSEQRDSVDSLQLLFQFHVNFASATFSFYFDGSVLISFQQRHSSALRSARLV